MGNVKIVVGNIVDDDLLRVVDAVVLPTNPMMRCGAGVSGAIFHKAGVDALESYTARRFGISYFDVTRKNEMKPTEVRVTPGFALPCSIIFAQGPKVDEYDDRQVAIDLLLGTYQNILKTARNYGFDAILLPALGTGSYGFTHEETAVAVIHLLNSFARYNNIEILFVLQSEKYVHMYSK